MNLYFFFVYFFVASVVVMCSNFVESRYGISKGRNNKSSFGKES